LNTEDHWKHMLTDLKRTRMAVNNPGMKQR
jgi:hypothetical protein